MVCGNKKCSLELHFVKFGNVLKCIALSKVQYSVVSNACSWSAKGVHLESSSLLSHHPFQISTKFWHILKLILEGCRRSVILSNLIHLPVKILFVQMAFLSKVILNKNSHLNINQNCLIIDQSCIILYILLLNEFN